METKQKQLRKLQALFADNGCKKIWHYITFFYSSELQASDDVYNTVCDLLEKYVNGVYSFLGKHITGEQVCNLQPVIHVRNIIVNRLG